MLSEAIKEVCTDPASNHFCWQGVPVQSINSALLSRQSADRLSATCLYLEDQGIKPDVQSIELFKRSIEFALHDPTSRKILFLFSFQPVYLDKPHAFIFGLEHCNSGNIEQDVACVLKEVEHFKNLISGCGDHFVDCIICTQEAYQRTKELIAYHSLPYMVTHEDEENAEKQSTLEEIYATLETLQPTQLPLARSIEDRLIGPYLYKLIVQRARLGLSSGGDS